MTYQIEEISIQLNRWIVLIILVLGISCNILNIAVFIRPVFNHHVCSWYFSALAATNCIYSIIVLLYRILADGFQVQLFTNSFHLCQFVSYISTFCTALSHYLTLFAIIDRWCASANGRCRQFNSFQVMPRTIFIITMLCALLAISSPLVADLKATDGLGCSIRSTTIYNQFYLLVQLILFDVIAPILMMVFTLRTVHNRKLAGDLPMNVTKCRRMEYNLTRMAFLLVAAHIVLNLPEWIEYLILLRPSMFESFIHIQSIIRIPIYCSYVLPIVWYRMLGKEYRQEFSKMIPLLAPLCRHTQVNAEVNNSA